MNPIICREYSSIQFIRQKGVVVSRLSLTYFWKFSCKSFFALIWREKKESSILFTKKSLLFTKKNHFSSLLPKSASLSNVFVTGGRGGCWRLLGVSLCRFSVFGGDRGSWERGWGCGAVRCRFYFQMMAMAAADWQNSKLGRNRGGSERLVLFSSLLHCLVVLCSDVIGLESLEVQLSTNDLKKRRRFRRPAFARARANPAQRP